ncbi:MAG: hypothetical protein ACK5LP_05440 [Campylobacteraceae bacterium]
MLKRYLILLATTLTFIIANDNITYFIQNPPPKPAKKQNNTTNANIKEVGFDEKFDAYFKCRRDEFRHDDCGKYIRNRYFDVDVSDGRFGIGVR